MADDRLFMHNHDNVGGPAVVRIFRDLPETTTLTVHLSQRVHVWLGERRSRRAPLRIHLLLHRISCGRFVSRRAGFHVSATRTVTYLSAECVGCQMQQGSTIGWELSHHHDTGNF